MARQPGSSAADMSQQQFANALATLAKIAERTGETGAMEIALRVVALRHGLLLERIIHTADPSHGVRYRLVLAGELTLAEVHQRILAAEQAAR